ncbi:carbon monoxide dehydrogenase subunit G [Methylopila capsulata]|uniref:Carbon monoxide dehydrogenase subunit G n=1 Tax=Methylopila capsulata TaxID=61654 RepID=A0A9W6IXR9_9HYPH|nr:carbon monoxide dehydrogenase subunit G [Methylopila capsulata]MBM7853540.1 carbon monoxide dehydrogenase subunit G [Methylopila capsulata]GLK57245.1 hypothetical protein GCM10008170_32650 [Methylopila capsulata]
MELSGSYRLSAPRDAVWAALNDPDALRASVPGCESLERISDQEMKTAASAKVGPVKALFAGTFTLLDAAPPHRFTLAGQASGGAAGFAKGQAEVTLTAEGAETVVAYDGHAEVGGKVAQLGSRVVVGVARQMAESFFANLAREIESRGAETPMADAPPLVHEEPAAGPTPTVAAPPLDVAAPPPPPFAPPAIEAKPSEQAEPEPAPAAVDASAPVSASGHVGRILLVAAVVIAIGFAVYHFVLAAPPPV